MDRLSIDQERIDELRTEATTSYPGKSQPCPGSNLKLDDDVFWLFCPLRVIWGYDTDDFFCAYAPGLEFGDSLVVIESAYISDRAPANPNESPLPIYPEPQQQQQRQAPKAATKTPSPERLRALIKMQPTKEAQKAMREAFKKHGLLKDEHGHHE